MMVNSYVVHLGIVIAGTFLFTFSVKHFLLSFIFLLVLALVLLHLLFDHNYFSGICVYCALFFKRTFFLYFAVFNNLARRFSNPFRHGRYRNKEDNSRSNTSSWVNWNRSARRNISNKRRQKCTAILPNGKDVSSNWRHAQKLLVSHFYQNSDEHLFQFLISVHFNDLNIVKFWTIKNQAIVWRYY